MSCHVILFIVRIVRPYVFYVVLGGIQAQKQGQGRKENARPNQNGQSSNPT